MACLQVMMHILLTPITGLWHGQVFYFDSLAEYRWSWYSTFGWHARTWSTFYWGNMCNHRSCKNSMWVVYEKYSSFLQKLRLSISFQSSGHIIGTYNVVMGAIWDYFLDKRWTPFIWNYSNFDRLENEAICSYYVNQCWSVVKRKRKTLLYSKALFYTKYERSFPRKVILKFCYLQNVS